MYSRYDFGDIYMQFTLNDENKKNTKFVGIGELKNFGRSGNISNY